MSFGRTEHLHSFWGRNWGTVNTVKEKFATTIRLSAFLQQWSVWLYLGSLVGLCALEVALGAMPTRVYAHDMFIFLDGAWRMANGQIPSRDFYSGYGVLVWAPLRWGLALYGDNANSLGLVRALYTAVIGLWFLLLTRLAPRRVPWILPGFFLLIFISAARPLGEHPTWVSHSMFYNRVAYALLFLIIFEQLGSFRFEAADHPTGQERHDTMQFWGGVSTGAALVLVPLLKVWFVLPGLALLATGLLLFGVQRRRLIGILSGGLGAVAFAVACLHLEPAAFLREALTLNQQRGSISGEALGTAVDDLGEIVFTLAAGLAVARAGFVHRRVSHRYVLATVAIAGCDLYCRAINAMNADLPLASFWCLCGSILLLSLPAAAAAATSRRQRMIALLVLCPLAIPLFTVDSASTVYAAYKTVAIRNHATLHFDSPRLRSWTPLDWLGENPNFVSRNGNPLILATNDGLHLLQNLGHPDETVSCVAFSNPFSYALGRRPAPGGALWLYLGSNFGLAHPLPENMLIGHPDLLMVERPNYVEESTTKAILALYPDMLTKEFALVGSSEYWTLYRRRP